ncbi:MAG TPA: NADH-quinone oxidoreductase subunit NuoN [Burkholderiaceae bacterium]
MNLTSAYPELFLALAASAILLIDMFMPDGKRAVTHYLSILTLIVCGVLSYMQYKTGETNYLFRNMFVSDAMSDLLKLFSYLAVGLTLVYSRQYATDRGMLGGKSGLGGEFYVLALFSLLGQMIMISGNNFLVIYLGLELMSLSLYALVALRRDHTPSIEASMKYFILGALASGFLLYGMSMLYGATGSLDVGQVLQVAHGGTVKPMLLVFGIVFVVAGLGFKLGAVPFHMWVPDVYQGAPTGVTLLLGGAPKLATFAIVIRLLVEGLMPRAPEWQEMLVVLAVLSMTIGNLTAIAQSNLKRMLAYSTIAQMGFMLLGLLSGAVDVGAPQYDSHYAVTAYGASMFYSITYVLTTLGTFGVILLLARSGFEAEEIADLKGLNQRSPWFAFVMALLMFSLAGIPPLMGFYAKLTVLGAVVDSHQTGLAVYSVIMSLIGAYYYLRVVKVMYFDDATDKSPIVAGFDTRVLLSLNGLGALVLGILPGPLMLACVSAIRQALTT